MALVIIENKAGVQYAVSLADFHKHYESTGFKVLRYENGEEYTPPASKAKPDKPEPAT